ncbi:MAG: OmpA family protein [Prevotellaceae bacterium]|nr:OmpA family protein [Prevotellaceae bacterium]
MIRNKKLKIVTGIIIILLCNVQPGFAEFRLLSFLQSKKNDPHCENCRYHINNFYPSYTLNHLDYTPTFSVNVMPDIDTDGDGIVNRLDECPATFGSESMNGCPPIDYTKSISYGNPTVRMKESDFNMFVEIFSKLGFEGAEQSLNKKSQDYLNELVKFLKKEKHLYLYISAYVDLSGNRMYNYQLSELRAQSVGNYLIKKGINSSRIGTLFFGDMMPVIELPATRFEVEICDKKKP